MTAAPEGAADFKLGPNPADQLQVICPVTVC